MNCENINCNKEAEVVTIETLSTFLCRKHYKERKSKQQHLKAVSIKKYFTEICPNQMHRPHVGCRRLPPIEKQITIGNITYSIHKKQEE